jgi:dolichyl-phosphate beta-glucosyltransferase
LFIGHITHRDFKDTQCGFKIFRHDAAHNIFSRLKTKGWGFDVEVLMLAQQLGYRIAEVPVLWRDAAGSHLRAGRDSIETLVEVMKVARLVKNNKNDEN